MPGGPKSSDYNSDPSGSGFRYWVVAKLTEIEATVRTFREEAHIHIQALPERTAAQMVLMQGRHKPTAPPRPEGRVSQTIRLLKAGLPYVELIRRTTIVLFLWGSVVYGTYNANNIADLAASVIRATLKQMAVGSVSP